MISDQISTSVDARFSEVRKLVTHIRNLESIAIGEKDTVSGENAGILRGLIFVLLYGAFEHSVTLSVQVLLQEISRIAAPYCEFEHLFHTVTLDPQFKSVSDIGTKNRWSKRKLLLEQQISTETCALNDAVFQDQLQNIWYATLSDLFEYLCIPAQAVPEDRMRGYIDEIVDFRNAIAHGRLSTLEVGRSKTLDDIEKRLEAITSVVNHVITCFDEFLTGRRFIVSRQRPRYLSPSQNVQALTT